MQENPSADFNSGQMDEPESSMRSATQNLTEKSKEAARNVKQKAREAKDTVLEKGAETAHQLRSQGTAYAEESKSQLGDRIHGYGSAVRRAADKLREEKDPNIAHYAETVAERLDQAADYVKSRDVGTILRDVENTARRHPEIFFGGMFVAGLALSRFFKASNERHEYEEDNEDYWVENEDDGIDEEPLSMDPNMQDTPPDFNSANGPQEQKAGWSQPSAVAPGAII